MPSDVVILRNRMAERRLQKLRETYGDSPREADVRAEQELARLFYNSGWTAGELAAKEGSSTARIGRMIIFGRFLVFASPGGSRPQNDLRMLDERRFRALFQQTDPGGNERQRFTAVLKLLANRDQS